MQNRFGLKDFVLFVFLAVLGLCVLLAIKQADRQWESTRALLDRVNSLEAQLNRISDKLDQGVGARTAPAGSSAWSGSGTVGGAGGAGSERDESWARSGVKVQWQPAYAPATDPRADPNFQAGGEFSEVWEAQFPRLTPFISTDVYSRRLQELVLGMLAEWDPKTSLLKGQLAEAWQMDPAGLWLRARLRAGVRFSDGEPVTAEDIRWTFHDYLMNEQVEAERVRSIYRDSIKEVKVLDARTVEFVFHEPLFVNESNALGLFVLPKHVYSKLSPGQINSATGLLMGSGPFRLRDFSIDRQWAPPQEVVLERNEQFWGPKPPLQVLRFKAITDELSRLNSLKKGDADMITPASTQFNSMKADPQWNDKVSLLNWVNMRSGYSFIGWNCGMRNGKLTPFHDKRVRMAMTHLLDRERMIRDIWGGIGVVAKSSMNPNGPASDPSIKPWPFDLAKAKQLLSEAGWEDRNKDGILEDANGNPFEFEYSYASGSEISEKIASFVMDACAAVGIKTRKRPADWSVYQDFMKLRDFDSITLGWGASAPESDPRQIFHAESIKNQGDNFVQWNSPEADRLIDEGRRELDTDKRMKIWQQLERVQHEEQPYTFVRVPPWLRIASPNIKNTELYFKGLQHDEFYRAGPSVPTTGN